ncbi:MAG: beta-lactamase family protein, partial [Candidatus Eremiobacteraeota bacterium]|nr:beta-lactamase family protein [Candidatus Eremiobacteraeota bacterium]
PGLAIGVVENGLLVFAKGYGVADARAHKAVTPATEFYAGSVSNEFTAAAVLLLAQQKKLALSDRVTKYVPELTIARDVTIAQLLQQTSGLPDLMTAPGITHDQSKPITTDALVRALNKMQLASAPGSKFAYNSANYMVAALIVARVSGVPFSVFLQTQIFEPLVMTSSLVAGDQGVSSDRADGYTIAGGKLVQTKPWDPGWLFGSGDLITNVHDLAKWDIGMPLLLNVDSVSAMWTPSGATGETSYGMGWVVDQRGGKRYIWHNGEVGGFHTMNALLPDQHIAVIVLANADSLHGNSAVQPERVASQILDVIAPLPLGDVENTILERAKEWIGRLQRTSPDRTQLTPAFNAYLTDELIARTDLKTLGDLQSLTPTASFTQNGDNVYVFLAQFPHDHVRFQMSLTAQGKIDGLLFTPQP